MRRVLVLLVLVSVAAGCAVCKRSDTPEMCRTKQRDHSIPKP